MPGFELPSHSVAVRAACGAHKLAERLRDGPVPVLARVRDDELLLDVRTLLEADDADLEAAFERALAVAQD